MPSLDHRMLHALTRATCAAAGSAEREAELVADHLVAANLTGHDSHGVGLLPLYTRSIASGALVPNRHAVVAADRGPILIIEGGRGYGQVVGHEAMELAMPRARELGVVLLAIRNSFHLGRIGHWAEQCARGGLASIHFVNGVDHPPIQALYGAAEARVSTNPFCAALPGDGEPLVVLDMATAKIAIGKARVAMNRGVPAPEGSLLDAAGRPTFDPSVMFTQPMGALVAMGLHKGSGLALMCELLAGALTGGWTNQPEHPHAGGVVNNMLSVVVDPDALGGREYLEREAGRMIAYAKSARPLEGFDEVLVPGEPERRRRAERMAHGIDVDQRTWGEILAAARAVGVPDERLDALLTGEA